MFKPVIVTVALLTSRNWSNVCMTEYLVAARAAIVLWTSLAVMTVKIVFDVIEAEFERRGFEPEA